MGQRGTKEEQEKHKEITRQLEIDKNNIPIRLLLLGTTLLRFLFVFLKQKKVLETLERVLSLNNS
jgi:hypothetical protein